MDTQSNTQEVPITTLSSLVDEFAELHQRLAPLQDQYEAVKKKLVAFVNADTTDEPITLFGYLYCVDYSAPYQTVECTLTPEELVAATGRWDALSVSTTQARKALTAKQFNSMFVSSPGSRRFRRVREANR